MYIVSNKIEKMTDIINNEVDNQLWLEKYRPTKFADYIGNDIICKQVETWVENIKIKKQKTPPFLVLHGKPGVGKTTLAHIILNEFKYDILEINASDHRTKTQINETIGRIGKYSVMSAGLPPDKRVLTGVIMDEIDGISAAGVIQELLDCVINKKTMKSGNIPYKYPVICTCNSIKEKKLGPLLKLALVIKIDRPSKENLTLLANKIITKENMTITPNMLNTLLERKSFDYRELINSLALFNILETESHAINKTHSDDLRREFDDGSSLITLSKFITDTKYSVADINIITESDMNVFSLDLYSNMFSILKKKGYWSKTEIDYNVLLDVINNFVYGDMVNHRIYQNQEYDLYKYLITISIAGNIAKMRNFSCKQNESHSLVYHTKFNSMCQEVANNRRLIKVVSDETNIADSTSYYYIHKLTKMKNDTGKNIEKIHKKITNLSN